jgi:hypothetical protein
VVGSRRHYGVVFARISSAQSLPVSATMFHCMLTILLCLFRFFRLLGSGHQAVAVENLALRRQLAVYKRKRRRLGLTQWDRLFWVAGGIVEAVVRLALSIVGCSHYALAALRRP